MTQKEKNVLNDYLERLKEQRDDLLFLLNSVHALMFLHEEGAQDLPDGTAAAFLGQFIDRDSAMAVAEAELKEELGLS
jgi:hypothetical protein